MRRSWLVCKRSYRCAMGTCRELAGQNGGLSGWLIWCRLPSLGRKDVEPPVLRGLRDGVSIVAFVTVPTRQLWHWPCVMNSSSEPASTSLTCLWSALYSFARRFCIHVSKWSNTLQAWLETWSRLLNMYSLSERGRCDACISTAVYEQLAMFKW